MATTESAVHVPTASLCCLKEYWRQPCLTQRLLMRPLHSDTVRITMNNLEFDDVELLRFKQYLNYNLELPYVTKPFTKNRCHTA